MLHLNGCYLSRHFISLLVPREFKKENCEKIASSPFGFQGIQKENCKKIIAIQFSFGIQKGNCKKRTGYEASMLVSWMASHSQLHT